MNNPPDDPICNEQYCEVRDDGGCELCRIFKLLSEKERLEQEVDTLYKANARLRDENGDLRREAER